MQRGEIWIVSLDPTAGHEQRGTRPVVIVSPAAFNELTGTPVVLPITTGGGFARQRGFAVSLDDAGIATTGVIRCDQPRVLDLAARNGKRVETVPEPIMDEVLARLATILE
jgi:mRNA interferase ChpB